MLEFKKKIDTLNTCYYHNYFEKKIKERFFDSFDWYKCFLFGSICI